MRASLTRRGVLAALGAFSSVPILAQSGSRVAAPSLAIQRLAWAGIRLSVGNVDLFVDATGSPPMDPPIPELRARGSRVFALATHHHPDHCDIAALRPILGERGYLVLHEETARLVAAQNVVVQAVRMHEPVLLSRGGGEFVARCVPAADGLGSPQVAWIIDGGGRRIIHCGDTAWHGGWWDIARSYGPFDAAFLPINGFRQTSGRFSDVSEPMSLLPEQAARAARILGARLAAPIHYGANSSESYVEERDALRRFQAECARLAVPVRAVAPGESFDI